MAIELKEKYPFSVDTWTTISKRKRHHFLTHAHSDHTGGIESFADRSIYCSDLTRRLVLRRFPKLSLSRFIILEYDEPRLVHDDEEAFTVTALDANHCSGAVMLLFEGNFGNVLHTGDCRLTEDCLKNVLDKYRAQKTTPSCVFLDCTFGKERLKMPSKQEASLQVRQCILDHPQAPLVYLASDMLGHEELLSDLVAYFKVKIYVDKHTVPEFYADLMIVAPELVTEDPESTRFHVCEGSPKLYERVKIKFMQAHTRRLPEPLFIRPSAQYYTFGERLEGAGCGMILDGALKRPGRQRRHLRQPKGAEKDEHGIWHVCYSMHSSRSELERAMEELWPEEVLSTTPGCHASEVTSNRVGLHHIDLSFATSARVSETHRMDSCIKEDQTEKANVGKKVLSSPRTPRAKKRACQEQRPLEHHHADEFSMFVPLFGPARNSIPSSPTVSFLSADTLQNEELPDSQSSVEDALDNCERSPSESQQVCPAGHNDILPDSKILSVSLSPPGPNVRIDVPLFGPARNSIPSSPTVSFISADTLQNEELSDSQFSVEDALDNGERSPGESQVVCPAGHNDILPDSKILSVSLSPPGPIVRTDDAIQTLSRLDTKSLEVAAQTESEQVELDELDDKENVDSITTTTNIPVLPTRSPYKRRVRGLNEETRKLYRTLGVPIPSALPSLLDM